VRLVLLGLVTLLATSAVGQLRTTPEHDTVETLLRKEMKERHIPGMQVAVVQHGKLVLTRAYGLADAQHSIPVTTKTPFSIASMTKAFTGVAIMQLVEEGKLDLDAPVSQYLSGLPLAWRPVTIQQLLTHVSGIPDIVDQKNGKLAREGSPEAFVSEANTLPMDFATGDRFSYNQTNYLLLGKVIEKLSGESFIQFVTQGQLDVAKMPNTYFGGFSDIIKDRAQPYALRRVGANGTNTEVLSNIFYESVPPLVAANGINTTAEQVADWIIALQHGRLLKRENSLSTMWTPGVLNNGSHGGFGGPLNGYALGWPVITRPTHRAMAPIGGNWAALFTYPDDDLSVVILTNLQGSHPEAFVDQVAGYFDPGVRDAVGFGIPRVIAALQAELMKKGFDHVLDIVNDPQHKQVKSQLRESDVNDWGYRLRGQGQQKLALEIFKLNVSLFPASANTYDSLADAYEGLGNRDLAVENYKRSLAFNPQNQNAVDRLKALESNSP
jgi:CubicO group peptidase (beta-lactamase class C family)